MQLPTNPAAKKVFGSFAYHSTQPYGQGSKVSGTHSYGLASVLYDVLNRVALDAVLAPSHSYEVDLAAGHFKHTETSDLVIYDRGYCSFRMLALASVTKGHFLVRCTSRSFAVANEMLQGSDPEDTTVTLAPGKKFLQNSDNKD